MDFIEKLLPSAGSDMILGAVQPNTFNFPKLSTRGNPYLLCTMTSTPAPFTRNTLPKTLRDWRTSGWEPKGTTPRDVWIPLEQFFLEQGLTLWKGGSNTVLQFFMLPGGGFPRSPDGFVYSTPVSDASPRPGFDVVVLF